MTENDQPERLERGAFGVGIALALRENRTLLLLAFMFVALTFGVAWVNCLSAHYRISLYSGSGALALLVTAFVVGIAYIFYLGLVQKESRPLSRILLETKNFFATAEKPAAVLIPLLTTALIGSAYSSFKSMIPALQPFQLDAAFADLDRLIHFGIDPWRLSHAVFGSAIATGLINFVYHLWFFAVWGTLLWQALALKQRRRRMKFFIAFVLVWGLLGALGAVLTSSAGPVYFGDVTGLTDPFRPLMARLSDIDAELVASPLPLRVWALDVQGWLWQLYQQNENGIGAGISAMPSMHVALATLIALVAKGAHRLVAWSAWTFLVLIQIGSVHLGWHYAIDGYVSIILTVAIWKLAGLLAHHAVGRAKHKSAPIVGSPLSP